MESKFMKLFSYKKILLVLFLIILAIFIFIISMTFFYNSKINKLRNDQEKSLLLLLNQNPKDDKIYSDLGIIYIFRKKYNIAENYLIKAIELNNDNYDANYWYIYIFLTNNEIEKAINKATELSVKYPEKTDLYSTLGALYEYNKDYINSLNFFLKQKILIEDDIKVNKGKYNENYLKISEKYLKDLDNKIKNLKKIIQKNNKM